MVKPIRDLDHGDLWRAYARTRDSGARARLMEAYLPLVRFVAERLVCTLPGSVDVDDLASVGTFGLAAAIERFEPARGFQFRTYGAARIRGAILDYLRTSDWVPRCVRLRARLVDRTNRSLHATLGRTPTVVEMADALGLTTEQYRRLCDDATPVTVRSLEGRAGGDLAEDARLIDVVADRRLSEPSLEEHRRDVKRILFRDLTEKERTILSKYYFEGQSMRQIGDGLRITESRVCQLHARVLKRLRKALEPQSADLFA
jgi:RNA polymerase sigma factor for flagellar operon FliA